MRGKPSQVVDVAVDGRVEAIQPDFMEAEDDDLLPQEISREVRDQLWLTQEKKLET